MPKDTLITCPKCHGKGFYEVPINDDYGVALSNVDKWKKVSCELCRSTGKIYLGAYEELQRLVREK